MIKKIIIFVMTFLFLFLTINAQTNLIKLNHLYLNIDDGSKTSKISYELIIDNNEFSQDKDLVFYLNVIHNEKSSGINCSKSIIYTNITKFKKITCELPVLDDGDYVFNATISDDNEVLLVETITYKSIFKNSIPEMKFVDIGNNQTEITILIREEYENIIIENEIPKGVIEVLNEENQNSLIETSLEYTILKEDPLIAWSVDRTPINITYKINKKISVEDQNDFKLKISQTSPVVKILKYVLFALIIIIIGFMFKPVIKKKNDSD